MSRAARHVTELPPAARIPAIVFGIDIGSLGVLRALVARGVRAYVADQLLDVMTDSRWYRSPGSTLAETSDSERLAGYLRSLPLERAMLIPTSDAWTVSVSGLPGELADRFVSCSAGRDVVEQMIDKELFRSLVERLDIPRPTTVRIGDPRDLDGLTDDQLRGGFLKPTDSQLHRRFYKVKGSFVTSRDAAERRVEEAMALGVEYLFQEWIPGAHSASILIDGMVDRSGRLRALTARRKLREYPRRLGTTSSSVGIRPDDVADAVDSVMRILDATAYRGLFNVEFKFDARDGRHKIIEFNPRACAYTGTIASAGVDLPWMAYLDAQGLEVDRAPAYPVGRHAFYEIADAKAIVHALRNGRRPEGAILRPWLTGDRALWWWKDPKPALGLVSRRIRRVLGRSPRSGGGAESA